jgi:hypothetical protein
MQLKKIISFIFFITFFSATTFAGDTYAEYKMTGFGNKKIISKLYAKNGEIRSEVNMPMGNKEMTMVTLRLKSHPGVSLVLNSMNKTYTETKNSSSKDSKKEISIAVLGNEKIGQYNCTHVRFTSNNKSWEMWCCKDLPAFSFPYDQEDAEANNKIIQSLKNKNIEGVPVKIVFLKPNSNVPTLTMELIKYEPKDLDASLFSIPADYKKNELQFDAAKMKNMTPDEKKEFIKKMIEQNKPH